MATDHNENLNGTETCATENCLNNYTPFMGADGALCVTCGMEGDE